MTRKLIATMPWLVISLTNAQTLTLTWRTDPVLPVPESVLYDPGSNALYVSCIDGKGGDKDGKGGVAKVATDGTVIDVNWVSGLNAPKGLGLSGKYLYIADLSQVVMVELASGKIVERINPEGAVYLNDITVDRSGDVYASDSDTGKIFRIKGTKASLYFDSDQFERINGLLALKDGMYVVDFANGINYKITSKGKHLTVFSRTGQGADGIAPLSNDRYLVSSWHGEIYYVDAGGSSAKILDTRDENLNAADIWFDPKSSMLYVPTFAGNCVMAYQFKD